MFTSVWDGTLKLLMSYFAFTWWASQCLVGSTSRIHQFLFRFYGRGAVAIFIIKYMLFTFNWIILGCDLNLSIFLVFLARRSLLMRLHLGNRPWISRFISHHASGWSFRRYRMMMRSISDYFFTWKLSSFHFSNSSTFF